MNNQHTIISENCDIKNITDIRYNTETCSEIKRIEKLNRKRFLLLKRREELIDMHGGKCAHCGFDDNTAALALHHVDPTKKLFSLKTSQLLRRSQKRNIEECEKCILVCHNCHTKIHYPQYNKKEIFIQ